MQIGQCVGDIVFRCIHIANSIHKIGPLKIGVTADGACRRLKHLLAQHDLDAEPNGTHQAGRYNRNHGLESVTLGLFHTFPPAPQVLEVGPELPPVIVFNSKGSQHRGDRFRDDRIEAFLLVPLLLCQGLGDDGPDFVVWYSHRLMILATFSKPRFAK